MSHPGKNLYQKLYDAVVNAYAQKNKKYCQNFTNTLWNELKEKFKSPEELRDNTQLEIAKLEQLAGSRKVKLTQFFIQVSIYIF